MALIDGIAQAGDHWDILNFFLFLLPLLPSHLFISIFMQLNELTSSTVKWLISHVLYENRTVLGPLVPIPA